jgi:hypothetical protein
MPANYFRSAFPATTMENFRNRSARARARLRDARDEVAQHVEIFGRLFADGGIPLAYF